MTQPSPSSLPSENLQRGVIVALIVVPLGIVAWDVLWSVGFVASIVAFGVAWASVRLYRLGSGGRITRPGAIAVTIITIATLVLAYVSGFVVDVVQALMKQGASVTEALAYPPFWGYVGQAMVTPQSLVSLLLAALFGALGCFSVLRGAFRLSRVPQDATSPNVPTAGPYSTSYTAPGSVPVQPTLMNPEGTPAVPSPPAATAPDVPVVPSATPPAYGERIVDQTAGSQSTGSPSGDDPHEK
ncbi:MAG: hypothetical protein M3N46_12995 [Actinomycetota bacterium]|nr:hypothetical protein [Actinomycetota bacterium]